MKNIFLTLEKWLPVRALFLFMCLLSIFFSVSQPFKNWDIICYMASAKAFEEKDYNKLHDFTYKELRKEVSETEYDLMTHGPYREAISKDVQAFSEQLPFYQIRPVYNSIVYLLYKSGVDIGFSTYIVSGVSVAIALLVLCQISSICLTKRMAIVILFLIFYFRVFDLSRFSTPDGMGFLAMVAMSYFFIRRLMLPVFLLAILIVGIRGDYILFTLPLLCCIAFFDRSNRVGALAFFALSIGAYFLIGRYWGNPGWSTIVYFTLVDQLPYPLSNPPFLSVDVYIDLLERGLRKLIKNKRFVLFLLFSVYMIYILIKGFRLKNRSVKLDSPPFILFGCSFFFVISHVILFPLVQDRFFSAAFLIGSLSVLWQANLVRQMKFKNSADHSGI